MKSEILRKGILKMNINTKLTIFIVAALLICTAAIVFIDRMAATKEIQNITKTNLQDLVKTTLNFVKTHDATDVKKLSTILNEETRIGRTGFIFILDSKGKLIVHKKAQGENWINKPFIKHIAETKSGYHRYVSPKTKTYKVIAYEYYEPRDWIITASNFEDDALAAPLKNMLLRTMLFLAPALVIILVASFLLIHSNIIKPVKKIIAGLNTGATQVSSSAEQISSSSQTLAEGASEQAASIEETSASLEEMSSMTKQNADNANHADLLMKDAKQVVDDANASMDKLTTSMGQLSKASNETSKIIKTIDEIAFQTNLLALNAAVEAARAGEAGAGFAVVADEVRSLALRAAEAAKNTSVLIEDTVKKISEGSELVMRTNEAFNKVSESTSKVAGLVSDISTASTEQSQGVEQINTAILEMDKVVQQNAASAEESASSSEEMHAQAEQMKGLVNGLVSLVRGSGKKDGGRQYIVGNRKKSAAFKTVALSAKGTKGKGLVPF